MRDTQDSHEEISSAKDNRSARVSTQHLLLWLRKLAFLTPFWKSAQRHHLVSVASLCIASVIAFHSYLTFEPLLETIENDIALERDQVTIEDDPAPAPESEEEVRLPQTTSSTPAVEGKQEKLLVVGKGDTLKGLLTTAGLDKVQAQHIVDAVKKVYNPKALKIGQGIKVAVSHDPHSGSAILNHMEWRAAPEQEIILTQSNGRYLAKKKAIELKKYIEGIAGHVSTNFYQTAVRLGAPGKLVRSAIQALSYEVNFQHDTKPNNGFALLYEVFKDNKGKVVRYGNVLYAAVAVKGKLRQVYRFEGPDGAGYFNATGDSVVRGLLRSPLDVTRLCVSSGFGWRIHPRGYSHMHQGVDFRAPAGTRVVAAAAGVITKAQYWGNFGLYVSIRHTSGYATEYAHLRKIAPGIRPGAKVSQGQFIGEVGRTGSATGTHLHYGVMLNGQRINPSKVKALPAPRMGQKDLARFVAHKKKIDSLIETRPNKEEYVFAIKKGTISA